MERVLILLASIALSAPALAQKMEPGEWQITSVTTSPMMPKPEVTTETECLTKEEAEDMDRWTRDLPAECKVTSDKKTANSYSWQLSCPKSGTRGSGTMRWTRTTMEGDIDMGSTGAAPGQKFEMRTKLTGKRLGPCKQ